MPTTSSVRGKVFDRTSPYLYTFDSTCKLLSQRNGVACLWKLKCHVSRAAIEKRNLSLIAIRHFHIIQANDSSLLVVKENKYAGHSRLGISRLVRLSFLTATAAPPNSIDAGRARRAPASWLARRWLFGSEQLNPREATRR